MKTEANLTSIGALLSGDHENPFELLGPHLVTDGDRRAVAVRAYLPQSNQAWVVDAASRESQPMRRIHPSGLYEAICSWPDRETGADGGAARCAPFAGQYYIRTTDEQGSQTTMHDPYAFPSLFTDYDLHLLGEGKNWDAYHRLGAQLRTVRASRASTSPSGHRTRGRSA